MPLMVAGAKSDGVTPGTILKSNVSIWLGAPASRMKMTFLALFCVVTLAWLMVSAARARRARKKPETPVPTSSKNWRRVQCGRSKKAGAWRCGYFSTKRLNFCWAFIRISRKGAKDAKKTSIVKDEVYLVVQGPEKPLGFLVAVAGAEEGDRGGALGVSRVARERVE